MLRKSITYTDFNDVVRTETFYFNLTEAELIELELSETGGYTEMLQQIVDAKDGKAIMARFRDLILRSYGVRSDDGRRFIKSEQLSEEFAQTNAYSALFFELVTDADASAKFATALIPASLANKPEVLAARKAMLSESPEPAATALEVVRPEAVKPTDQMTIEELREALRARGEG